MRILLKDLLLEGALESAAEDFLKQSIRGTPWAGKVFAAGGYVRDQIIGRDAKDLDILVDYPNGGIEFAKWLTKKVGNFKEGSNPVVFERFGTSKFNLNGVTHNGIDLTGFEIEAVMPRSEKYTAGSRKPDVQLSTLKGDAERRDLTFNSLFKNLSTGEILDLTGKGVDDLKTGTIRTPLDPDSTFKDDPLRMLRVVRFYAKYNYEIPLNIIRSLKRNAPQIENISSERIQDELNKMLVTTQPDKALKLLKIVGLLGYIIPEFKDAYKMTQNKHHVDTVFNHILKVVKGTPADLVTRLQALFHDLGKTKTRSVVDNEVHFYNHENIGADMTKEVLKRLKYPVDVIDAVVTGVKYHMRLKGAGKEGEVVSDKALRKFAVDLGDHLNSTLNLMHSDNLAHSAASVMPNQIPNIIKRIEQLKSTIPTKGQKLPISGDDLKSLGLKPGPLFAELLNLVKEKQLENPNTTKEEYLDLIKNHLNSNIT